MSGTTIVVPCYNEAARLPADDFVAWEGGARLLFVDDGSTDGTGDLLEATCARAPERLSCLRLERNGGKGEAVRQGLRAAFAAGPEFAGWLDADLAAPLDAIPVLLAVFDEHPETDLVLGSRVKLLGKTIERRALRHYLGRGFATCASLLLQMPVYDTQCGAKLLRVRPETKALFDEPFLTRWLFDIEVLLRWTRPARTLDRERARRVREEPLPVWKDVAGSKVGPASFARAAWDLLRLRRRYR